MSRVSLPLDMNSHNINVAQRLDYIDILRGIGIILMTIGHIGFTPSIEKWIYSFHMPLFYLISEYFFKKKDPLDLIKKLSKSLLIPYISFGMMYILVSLILGNNIMSSLYHLFLINTEGLAISPALWFLTSLFFVEIIYCILYNKVKNQLLLTTVIFIIMLFGMALPYVLKYRLSWALDTAFVGLGFYHIAKLFNENLNENKILNFLNNLNSFSIMLFLIIMSILVLLNNYVNMRRGMYVNIFIFLIGALGLSIAFLNISKKVYAWSMKYNVISIPVYYLKSIGRNSITYVCLNHLIILIIRQTLCKFGIIGLKSSMIILFLSLILLYFCDKIFRNTPIKIFLGV